MQQTKNDIVEAVTPEALRDDLPMGAHSASVDIKLEAIVPNAVAEVIPDACNDADTHLERSRSPDSGPKPNMQMQT